MNSTFFTENEDLYSILANNFQGLDKNIKKIATGWTNIVLDVQSNNESYIAKLPRDDFWAKHIEKDAIASNFVHENIGIKTADMKIFYDQGRPFSIHKKIEGVALTERLKDLTSEKISKIAKKLAEIFYSFHSFNISDLPKKLKVRYYDFVSNLPKLDEKKYDFSYFNGLLNDEKNEEQTFIHGDLNIGNVLLDDNDNVEAVIDYAFCGLGDKYTDLSILACRIDDDFFDRVIFEYQKVSGKTLDMKKMKDRKELRQYIEKEYMAFMKANHPEIKF